MAAPAGAAVAAPSGAAAVQHHLGRSLSLEAGAASYTIGECILVRLSVDGHVGDEATGTDLPPTSNRSSPQHLAFIRQVIMQEDGSYLLEVYVILSFTGSGGAIASYYEMDDATRATLLPLPPSSHRHPTPEAFGAPLSFEAWSALRDSWLSIIPRRVFMPSSRPFKRMVPPLIMHPSVLRQIELYRATLRSNPQTTSAHRDDQPHPPPNGGSGDEQGSSHLGQQQPGDGGGQASSGVTSLLRDVPWHLSQRSVDEDAEGPDATMLDDLMLMALGDPMWTKELRKYLQKEENENEEMQKERAARLARWREGITVQPT
ncbi:hypothetical protein BJV78DRAFT_1191090 [Lactifluus subvellereus]|nr:hypothetical protein BJV78DRAFT_1191090 [Lactifluus subvellereus]